MELTAENVEKYINMHIRPRVRVDGGEILFKRLEGSTVYVESHNQCASCPATCEGFQWWVEKMLSRQFSTKINLSIKRVIPYFS